MPTMIPNPTAADDRNLRRLTFRGLLMPLAFAVGQRPSPASTRMETAGPSVRSNAFAVATVRESPVAWKTQPCPGARYPKAGIGHFRSQTERC